MRLLADRLLATDAHGDPHIARAQELLRVPAQNHMPANIDQVGKCDRFVLSQELGDALCDDWNDSRSRDVLFRAVRSPLPELWLEFRGVYNFGYLIENDCAICFIRDPHDSLRAPQAVFRLHLEIARRDGATVRLDDLIEVLPGGEPVARHNGRQGLVAGIFPVTALAAITSPRAATQRRKRLDDDAAARAMRLRRFQRGRPIFSYNQVDLVIPKTCIYRGEVRAVASFEGMRGHMVIGHWRLIDKVLEPFWVWIDGHERGDRERGWIVKQRNVTYVGDGIRRGFTVPSDYGDAGEHRKAMRA